MHMQSIPCSFYMKMKLMLFVAENIITYMLIEREIQKMLATLDFVLISNQNIVSNQCYTLWFDFIIELSITRISIFFHLKHTKDLETGFF